MFGRRKVLFGSKPSETGQTPPPAGVEPFPIDKMDDALKSAIMLFTRVLDDAGIDAGGLAIRGDPGPNVSERLANSVIYRSKPDELTYLALGITQDFKQFMYPPHCRLYFILNSTGICEHPASQSLLNSLAPGQLPSPLIDAHLMRRWIRYILPTGEAKTHAPDDLEALMKQLIHELVGALRLAPAEFAARLDLKKRLEEWISGFPGTIGRPLDGSVQRMTGLPVTPFIGEMLTQELAQLQMQGLSQRR